MDDYTGKLSHYEIMSGKPDGRNRHQRRRDAKLAPETVAIDYLKGEKFVCGDITYIDKNGNLCTLNNETGEKTYNLYVEPYAD